MGDMEALILDIGLQIWLQPVRNHTSEAREFSRDAEPTQTDSKRGNQDQRPGHRAHALRRIGGAFGAWLPKEGEADLPRRIEGSQESRNGQSHEDPSVLSKPCGGENLIL